MSFRESAPLLTSESATAPLNALAVLAMRMRSLTPMGRPVLKIGNPGSMDLPLPLALHHSDDPRRAAAHGDQVLERPVEHRVAARGGRPLASSTTAIAVPAARTEATAITARANAALFMFLAFRSRLLAVCSVAPRNNPFNKRAQDRVDGIFVLLPAISCGARGEIGTYRVLRIALKRTTRRFLGSCYDARSSPVAGEHLIGCRSAPAFE